MLELYSHPKNIALVEEFVSGLSNEYSLPQTTYGNILTSLTEAVNNAIRHGNGNDINKKVRISLKKQQECLQIRVCDEGHGFNPQELPDPTSPDRLLMCGGRGVFIMQSLCDQLAFHDNGSTVEMQFAL